MKFLTPSNFALISIAFFSCHKTENCPEIGLQVRSHFSKKLYDQYYYCNNEIVHHALLYDVAIINCTDSTKKYVCYTQSWEDNWTYNDTSFRVLIESQMPGGNFPVPHSIPPHDSAHFKFILYSENEATNNELAKLKFGFVFIDGSNAKWMEEFNKWNDLNNLASTGFEEWFFAKKRSASEIKSWKKEHGIKSPFDGRTIWEK